MSESTHPNAATAADDSVVEFLVDTETGRSFSVDREEPDPAFVQMLISEAQRVRKELAQVHQLLVERMFRVAQMWMAGAALFAAGALWQPSRAGWALAAGYAAGFALALYGQRARTSAPAGVAPAAFNDWRALRTRTETNLQVMLSTWDAIIERAHDEIAWRAKWLNVNLGVLAVFTVAALGLRAVG